ncbi:MAG: outer membrane beta-barrel protein [Duncaniella sp.]|nr:outer membrane beta-barrel protein [Duncaniella sp.]
MHKQITFFFALMIGLMSAPSTHASERPDRFIDLSVHTLWGGTYLANNYNSTFPEISHLNTMMGVGIGAGVGVNCNITQMLSIGTELNILVGHGKMDMAVASDNSRSVSNVFQSNSYTQLLIPVFVSFTIPVADKVAWEIDPGIYARIGAGGTQKTTIYDAKTNALGQLITSRSELKTNFYVDADGFLNSVKRAGFGIHLATRLRFNRHFSVGLRTEVALINAAYATGVKVPKITPVNLLAEIGWRF